MIKGEVLISLHWLTNFANSKRFGHSYFRDYFPHLDFFEETITKYLQLCLPNFINNQLKSDIKRAHGPKKLV